MYLRLNDALEYAVRLNRKSKDKQENILLLNKIEWQLREVKEHMKTTNHRFLNKRLFTHPKIDYKTMIENGTLLKEQAQLIQAIINLEIDYSLQLTASLRLKICIIKK